MIRRITLDGPTDFAGWRNAARALLLAEIAPEEVSWCVAGEEEGDLFAGCDGAPPPPAVPAVFTVPRAFVELAEAAILHKDRERFALLYRLLWRLRAEPQLLSVAVDPLVARISAMAKAVRREIHKMHAFVRFRQIAAEDGARFVAWFEPEHHIVEAAAPFFRDRFAAMRWSILTPERCVHWDGETLAFTEGAPRTSAPAEDALEEVWRSYYASIFNPARLKVEAMASEMPRRYWRNLPEAQLIKPLIETANRRTEAMVQAQAGEPKARPQRLARATVEPSPIAPPDAEPRPASNSDVALEALRAEAAGCRNCPLWEPATQTVFGEGPASARVMLVGEQPGDKEDIAGRPFVGPAGQLLGRALEEAGVDRTAVYVTNAVKHFKFVPRGKARIHAKPNSMEIQACHPWLDRELDLVRPDLVVAMGATAVQSLFGKALPIGKNRGRLTAFDRGGQALITVHPSYLLRLPDAAAKAAEYARFVEDLRLVAPFVAARAAA